MQDKTISRVGVIGLGKMGSPMAGHLLRRGFAVTGYDRSDEASACLAQAGGKCAKSCAQVAAASDLVLIVVGFDSQVDQTLFAADGICAGAADRLIVAVASTVPPSYMRLLPSRLSGKAMTLLDIPLTRAEQAAEKGTLLLLGGGDRAAFDRCRPAFSTFASDIAYLGELGAGQVGKMINNFILWTCRSVNYEAFKFAKTLGVDPETLRDALAMSTAQNWAMTSRADERGAPWAEKDMMILLKEADTARVSIPLAGVVKEVIKGFKIDHGYPMPSEE
jgi:3-hydroxyisobutyrate dehydrogenase